MSSKKLRTNGENNHWLLGGIVGLGALTSPAFWGIKRRTLDFCGKIAVITGGSRGLGLVSARQSGIDNFYSS